MNSKKQNRIKYALTFLIPILVIIGLFFGGIGTGIITFEQEPKNPIFNPRDNPEDQNPENQTTYINATMEIDFGNGIEYSNHFQLEENLTVFDFLLITEKTGEIILDYTYWEQYDSYFIDSMTYNNQKYEGDSTHFWVYYINDVSALEGADKVIVNHNDTIRWEYTEF